MLHALVGLLLVSHPLPFSEALTRADAGPAVAASQAIHAERSKHARDISSLTANPVLQVQPGARAMEAGGTGAELYLGVSQRFNLGGLARKRKQTVRQELAQDEAATVAARSWARRAIAEAWLARWRAQGELRAAEREGELAREFLGQVSTLVAAGEATQVDLASARAWQAEATLARLNAEGTGFEAGVALSRAMGGEVEGAQAVSDELPSIDLPEAEALASELRAVEEVASVRLARRAADAERARLDEVGANRAPTLAMGVLGWREGGGDVAAVATLELELPAFERGQRERSEQAAVAAKAAHAAQAEVRGVRTERVLALHEVAHTAEMLRTLEQELVAASEALAEAERIRFAARESTARDWVIARRSALKAQLDALKARADHVLARFVAQELFTLAGTPP